MSSSAYQLGFLFAMLVISNCQEHHIAQTPAGRIRGILETHDNVSVYKFRGIPYAKPPVGELRFRKPVPLGAWDYVLDATKEPAACMQDLTIFNLGHGVKNSEDCLFLNIYVPHDISISNNKSVMMWIHGGGFVFGYGNMYDGSYLAKQGDVIVVTINYRLGIFGFLTTMDQSSPGNYALWDQRLAMQWVKSNIAAFGGNPSSITIFGESAGGMSVAYQSIIPYNKGLFQRVIAQSGVANNFPLISNPSKLNTILAKKLNCPDGTSSDSYSLVNCFRGKSAEELLDASMVYGWPHSLGDDFNLVIGPSLDNDLFLVDPKITLADQNSAGYNFFRSLDFMTGTTDGEGTVMLIMMTTWSNPIKWTEGITTDDFCHILSPNVVQSFFNNTPGIAEAICDNYKVELNEIDHLTKQAIQSTNMFGDVVFVAPATNSLRSHSKESSGSKTFQYLFSRPFTEFLIPYPAWFEHSAHAIDLLYLFGSKRMAAIFNVTLIDEDLVLEKRMSQYWVNFAKYGDPNGNSLPEWPEFGQDENYMQLDHTLKVGKKLFPERMEFLLKDVPNLMEKELHSKREEL